jgi:hypothetical protein
MSGSNERIKQAHDMHFRVDAKGYVDTIDGHGIATMSVAELRRLLSLFASIHLDQLVAGKSPAVPQPEVQQATFAGGGAGATKGNTLIIDRISVRELYEIFGDAVPISVVKLLREPAMLTVPEMRALLKLMK